MKNTKKNLLTIVLVSGLLILFVWYISKERKPDKKFDWTEDYRQRKEPYGMFVSTQILKSLFKDKKFVRITNPPSQILTYKKIKSKSTYVFIGSSYYFDAASYDTLCAFVKRGNTAFLSIKYFQSSLLDSIVGQISSFDSINNYQYFSSLISVSTTSIDTAKMNFNHPQLKSEKPYYYYYKNLDENVNYYYWSYFQFLSKTKEVSVLGTYEDLVYCNFIKVKYGKGEFLFHTTPITFTNMFAIEERGKEYIEKVLSHIPEGDIYFDEISSETYTESKDFADWTSPLRYILGNLQLKTAWYLLLSMALLYVIFRAKRRQRVIPVLDDRSSTSLEFIEKIGLLYFQQHENRNLAMLKRKHFLNFIRRKYYISFLEWTDKEIEKLSQKSRVDEYVVNKIFEMHKYIDRSKDLTEDTLIDYHNYLTKFYKQCR